ncbi:MAG: hypothetical protein VKJ05_03935 [Synechococcaceae cyanobacterium]|nr:hypothetical protein [Synechococcaceae cyanobacterium]
MSIPALSFDRLASLQMPHLELGEALAAWRSDPSTYSADWLRGIERLALPALPLHAADGLHGPAATLHAFGPFSLVVTPFQLTLQEQGSARFWYLDTAWFGGSPLLVVAQIEGGVDIALADAFFPGTTIPASLRASIRCRAGLWTLRLRLKVGGFDATVPLSSWLERKEVALSPVHLDLVCAPLGSGSSLTARGPGIAAFTPDWLLGIWAIDGFHFAGLAGEPQADLALVGLRPPGSLRLFFPSGLRRTVLQFAGAGGFALRPEFYGPGPSFHLGAFRFGALALETALLTDAWAQRLLFAQSGAQGSPLGLEPGGGLWGDRGEPFRVPLHQVRYGQLFNQRRERIGAGLVAQPGSTPFWLHSAGLSLLLEPSPKRPAIGLLQKDALPPGVLCRLGLRQSAPRLEGLLVRPEPAPPRAEVLVTWRPLPGALAPELGHVEIDPQQGSARLRLPADTSLAVVRRDDFLHLRVRWSNLRLETEAGERRLRSVTAGPAHLAMILPPQSIGEETFPEPSGPGGSAAVLPVKALLAKPSRLVFLLQPGAGGFRLDSASLLDWPALTPSLAPTALPAGLVLERPGRPNLVLPGLSSAELRPQHPILGNQRPSEQLALATNLALRPVAPPDTVTQIEIPFRLLLSPNRHATWVHAREPVCHNGRSELWHTRLAVRTGGTLSEAPHPLRTARAIWSRDHALTNAGDAPFRMPLNQERRLQIVHLSSDFTIPGYAPPPLRITTLMLSALGGWLESDLQTQPPFPYSIEQWRHRASLGRDHFVRVVDKGFLLPLGHRVSCVTVSERKVQPAPTGEPVAWLRQRQFLVVREPERRYEGGVYRFSGREMPLRRVRLLTLVSPDLDEAKHSPLDPGEEHQLPLQDSLADPNQAFWPCVGGKTFRFHLRGWDAEGQEVDFLMPLAFVRADVAGKAGMLQKLVTGYNSSGVELRQAPLEGQRLALAESGGSTGSTSFETAQLLFQVVAPADASPEPPCQPALEQAEIALAVLRQISGTTDASAAKATLELAPLYLQEGFHPQNNLAGLFARVPTTSAAPRLDYTQARHGDRAGGIATPNLEVRGLCRALGIAGGTNLNELAKGHFDPTHFFAGADARLLGGLALANIVKAVPPEYFLVEAPKLITRHTAEAIHTSLDWSTANLQPSQAFQPEPTGRLSLRSDIVTPLVAGGSPQLSLGGSLQAFSLRLADVVTVQFEKLAFAARNGSKPDVDVRLRDVAFCGDLSFLNELQQRLALANFADPPFLEVSADGIIAGYSLTIPLVPVGLISLQNIALACRFSLPFTGEPMRLRFNASERHNPFLVSLAPYGGGGFFALAVGLDGVETVEASIEFGGCAAINLGPASGAMAVMAGIYVQLKLSGSETVSELTGYLRANGALEVLGLVTLALEFYLGLSYAGGKAWGECRVTVSVEVLFFSADVSLTMRREFASCGSDPPFADMMPLPNWQDYAAAFA